MKPSSVAGMVASAAGIVRPSTQASSAVAVGAASSSEWPPILACSAARPSCRSRRCPRRWGSRRGMRAVALGHLWGHQPVGRLHDQEQDPRDDQEGHECGQEAAVSDDAVADRERRIRESGFPNTAATRLMITSSTSELTTAANATPSTNATASSSRLPLSANSLNSRACRRVWGLGGRLRGASRWAVKESNLQP